VNPRRSGMTLGVAVIGYGRMGLIHARNAYDNPRITLRYIVGRNQEKLNSVASQFQGVQAVTELSIALNDPAVGGVIVCSPSQSHPEHIIQVH
jgi:myo-inositol 2-dehydrogenase / D-chiro-inositol 1-dehydrogenase